MILKDIHNIETSLTNVKEFSLKTNNKLFKILSDNLYSDKIGSIIRELASNCIDSHMQAEKKHIPFEITLPCIKHMSDELPMFKIKDFGVGISEEDIYNIYTTYGESTKTESNEYIGAFGLGSKTPFSYTDTFFVTSIYNSSKKYYNAFLNEHGCPVIAKIFEENTNECNGLEVSFSVKSENIREFREKTLEQLQYIKPFPIIINEKDFFKQSKKSSKILFKTKKFEMLSESTRNIDFLINGLCYSLTYEELSKTIFQKNIIYFNKLIINLNIGDIDLTASRENISFTNKTIKFLRDLFNEIFNKLFNNFEKYKLNNSLWDYGIYLQKYFCDVRVLNNFNIDKNILDNIRKDSYTCVNITDDIFNKNPSIIKMDNKYFSCKNISQFAKVYKNKKSFEFFLNNNELNIYPDSDFILGYSKTSINHLKKSIKDSNIKKFLIIKLKKDNKDLIKKLSNMFNGCKVVDIDNMLGIVNTPNNITSKVKKEVVFIYDKYDLNTGYLNEISSNNLDNIDKNSIFICKVGDYYYWNNIRFYISNLKKICKILKINYIYCANKLNYTRLVKYYPEIEDKSCYYYVKRYFETIENKHMILFRKFNGPIIYNFNTAICNFIQKNKLFNSSKDSILVKLAKNDEILNDIYNIYNMFFNCNKELTDFFINININKKIDYTSKVYDYIDKKYPMLSVIDTYELKCNNKKAEKKVFDYIMLKK